MIKRTLFKAMNGNIIFTEFGLNGPGVMNLSHLIAPESEQNQSLQIDFLPGSHQEMLETLFIRERTLFLFIGAFSFLSFRTR